MRQLQILGLALVAGPVLFAAVAVVAPFVVGAEPGADALASGDPPAHDASVVGLLSLMHVVLFATLLPLALILPQRLAARGGGGLQQTMIMRWAMVEGVAFFGSVVVLLGGLEGRLPGEPIFYANLASTAVLALLVLTDLGRSGVVTAVGRRASAGSR